MVAKASSIVSLDYLKTVRSFVQHLREQQLLTSQPISKYTPTRTDAVILGKELTCGVDISVPMLLLFAII